MIQRSIQRLLQQPFFIQLLHWEYWSFTMVYLPLYPVFLWYGIKARSFFFFSAANPSIKNGGFLMESKKDIDAILPQHTKPTTLFFEAGTDASVVIMAIEKANLSYPLIIKPDIGGRGRGVKKVDDAAALTAVIPLFTVSFIIQPFVPFANEIGLFYVRMPNESVGTVTGIVRKMFMKVTGDGKRTILELLQQNERYILQIPSLKKIIPEKLGVVLPDNVSEILVPYGNHARGCLFIDDTHLVSNALNNAINAVCTQIPDFYYGRLDIRFESWESLLEGKNFSIIELNGSGSEPTHIYDPTHSIFFAWKEIIKHWKWMYVIAKQNHQKGVAYLTFKQGLQMLKESDAYSKKLNALIV